MNCPHCNVHIDAHEASRCLDAWVAKAVMKWEGFHVLNYQDGDTWYSSCKYCYADGANVEEIRAWQWGDPPIPGCDGQPYYSTSIDDAMAVVEKMRTFSIGRFENNSEWECVVSVRRNENTVVYGSVSIWATDETKRGAPTAPLAICRAVLKAV